MGKTGKAARNKGIRAELKILHEFQKVGYAGIQTTRNASRYLDGLGVEFVGLPFNCQVKATEARPKYKELLNDLQKKARAGKIQDAPAILFHRRSRTENLVIMKEDDFFRMLKELKE